MGIRTLYRRFYWAPRDARYWRQLANIDHLVYLGGGGIGDSLNCSAVVRELNRRHPGRVSIMTPHPELFEASSSVRAVYPYDHELVTAARRWSRTVLHPIYELPQVQPPVTTRREDHLIARMCASIGIHGEITLKPDLQLHPSELAAARAFDGAVFVQSSALHSANVLAAKNWMPGRMEAVVSALKSRYRIVQIGHCKDPLLRGAEDLRGKPSLRAVAAMMTHAKFFIGLVGFLMHLARASGIRSVIVYGGREHPYQSGYPCNENVYSSMPCSPCGINEACSIGHGCMTQIEPSHVLEAVERLELRLESPLETDVVSI